MLGVIQPEERISVFKDALTALSNKSTYLYFQSNRYWYDAHPNLRKTVEERASKIDDEEVKADMSSRLNSFREKGDFARIHICAESEDISDDDEVGLVVMQPDASYRKDSQMSNALHKAKSILDNRGNIPRKYKNMLIFLAPDSEIISNLDNDVRRYLAWKSVDDDKEALNLDAHQRRQVGENLEKSDKTVNIRLNEAYSWLLIPVQEGTKPIKLEIKKIMKGDGSFISRASKQAKNEELLITKWSPALLNNELDKWLWQHSKHINTKQMWEYFASYPYLPRLKDSSVLTECIKEGLRSRDFFGYASDMDSSERYLGLEFGNPGVSVSLDPKSVLIKKEEALKQALEEDKQQKNEHGILEGLDKHHQTKSNKEILEESKATIFRRFYGRANLDPMRVSRDADQKIS